MRWARVCALVLVLGCAACHGERGGDDLPRNYLHLADKDDVPTLDPARGYDVASWQFEDLIFETLLDYDDNDKLAGELADKWEVDAAGLTYTFVLRADATFSNGRAVGAADVKYGIQRVLTPATKSPAVEFYNQIVGAERCSAAACDVEGLEVVSPRVLRIHLMRFDPLFLHKMAMPFSAAVPEEVVRQLGEDFARAPVGSGPFVLREWRPGERLIFAARADVPRPSRLAGVVGLVGVGDDLSWLKYRNGELDVVSIPAAEFPLVIRDPQSAPLIQHVTTLRTQYLGLNCTRPPFTDRRVRQALNYAVNQDKLLRLQNGRGVAAHGVVPPTMPGYQSQVRGYEYSPDKARKLLAEAGLPKGFESTLWLRHDDAGVRLAQSIQQDLALVGVQISIKPIAWGPLLEAIKRTDEVPMFLLGWEADFPDASNFLEVLFHSKQIGTNNNTNYRNPEVDRLLEAAALTAEPAARAALLQQVETIIFDDAPWVFLYHPFTYKMTSSRVRNFKLDPLRPDRLANLWLDPQS